jgi:hypothetical protein
MLKLGFWTSIDLIASIHYKETMSRVLAIPLEAKFGEFTMPNNE